MAKQFSAVLRLRRDNDYNYAKVKDTFVPANGEICLVDTASDGLQMVCGDGKSTFGQLSYVMDILLRGYFYDNKFYKDEAHKEEFNASTVKIYLDIPTYSLYIFDGVEYHNMQGQIPTASESVAGVVKLYNTTGQNVDGTMSQKAISDELDDKIEMAVNESEETLILDYDIIK